MSRQYFNLNSTTNTNQNFMSFVENDNVLNYLNDFDFTEQEDKNSSNMNFLEIQQEQRMDEQMNYQQNNQLLGILNPNFTNSYNNLNNAIFTQPDIKNLSDYNQFTFQNIINDQQQNGMDSNEQKQKPRKNTQKKVKELNLIKVEEEDINNLKNIYKVTYQEKIGNLIGDSQNYLPNQFKSNYDLFNTSDVNNLLVRKVSRSFVDEEKEKLQKNQIKQIRKENKNIRKTLSSDQLKNIGLNKLGDKLRRNRESARNSRKRKKIYVNLLEQTVEKISEELEASKKQNETFQNIMKQQQSQIINFLNNEKSLIEKLSKGKDANEINLLIDSYKFRFGSSGKERQIAINQSFKDFQQLILPNHIKYLLWNSVNNIEYYEKIIFNKCKQENQQNNDNTIKTIMKFQKKMNSEFTKLQEKIYGLNDIKDSILQQTKLIENQIDQFQNYFEQNQVITMIQRLENQPEIIENINKRLWKKQSDLQSGFSSQSEFDENNCTIELNYEKIKQEVCSQSYQIVDMKIENQKQ